MGVVWFRTTGGTGGKLSWGHGWVWGSEGHQEQGWGRSSGSSGLSQPHSPCEGGCLPPAAMHQGGCPLPEPLLSLSRGSHLPRPAGCQPPQRCPTPAPPAPHGLFRWVSPLPLSPHAASAWVKSGPTPPNRLCPPLPPPPTGCLNCSRVGELTARLATLEAQVRPPPKCHQATPPGTQEPREGGHLMGCPPHCSTQPSHLLARWPGSRWPNPPTPRHPKAVPRGGDRTPGSSGGPPPPAGAPGMTVRQGAAPPFPYTHPPQPPASCGTGGGGNATQQH